MPAIHADLKFLGKRIRGLVAAVAGDEPLRKAEAGGAGLGGGVYIKGAAWDGSGFSINAANAAVVYGIAQADGVISLAAMTGDPSGSATVAVWKVAAGAALPTAANKISATAPVTITAGSTSSTTTLTGWSTAVVAGDIFAFKLLTCSGFTWLGVTLEITP